MEIKLWNKEDNQYDRYHHINDEDIVLGLDMKVYQLVFRNWDYGIDKERRLDLEPHFYINGERVA